MKNSEKYTLEIGAIQNDINELQKGNYSHALADRLDMNFNKLIRMIDNNELSGAELIAKTFDN